MATLRHGFPSHTPPVRCIRKDVVSPPVRERVTRIQDREKHDDAANGRAGVQGRSKNVWNASVTANLLQRGQRCRTYSCTSTTMRRTTSVSLDLRLISKDRAYLVLDPVVKDQVHDGPRAIVYTRRGRDIVGADKDERPVHVLEEGLDLLVLRVLPSKPGEHRRQDANPEEVQ